MASSLSTTPSASASLPAVAAKNAAVSSHCCGSSLSKLSFPLSPRPRLRLFTKGLHHRQNKSIVLKGQLNEVTVDGSSNAAVTPSVKSGAKSVEAKDAKPLSDASQLASEESISEFITQVSSLVKLVDSRDIVELQLKQLDCELIIRKKEALAPPASAPVVMMQSPAPPPMVPAAPAAPASVPSAPAPSAPSPAAVAPAAKSPKSSHPPLKCPMAGTLYRSPAPGEPPFVKVGDKVQKGQVVCIIEAMKLMNEIEADQSGTVIEIIAEDGKPVSVDTPLLVIAP